MPLLGLITKIKRKIIVKTNPRSQRDMNIIIIIMLNTRESTWCIRGGKLCVHNIPP